MIINTLQTGTINAVKNSIMKTKIVVACLALATLAKENANAVSFDLNYAQNNWQYQLTIDVFCSSPDPIPSLTVVDNGQTIWSGTSFGYHLSLDGLLPADLLPDSLYGIGLHVVSFSYLDSNGNTITVNDAGEYTVIAPLGERLFPTDNGSGTGVSDTGNTMVLLGIGTSLLGFIKPFAKRY